MSDQGSPLAALRGGRSMLLSDRDVEIWSSPCLEVGEQPGICLCLIRELHEILTMGRAFADIADLLCVCVVGIFIAEIWHI